MRIISPFRDYYDGVTAGVSDPGLVYQRQPATVLLPAAWPAVPHAHADVPSVVQVVVLGFCGTQHLGIITNGSYTDYHRERAGIAPETVPTHAWDAEAYALLARLNEPPGATGRRYPRWGPRPEAYDPARRFQPPALPADLHVAHGVPLWLYAESFIPATHQALAPAPGPRLFLNPGLRELEFFRVRDAYQAYQQLSEFVGGVLQQPAAPAAQASDADRLRKHGFDEKRSFRKMPRK